MQMSLRDGLSRYLGENVGRHKAKGSSCVRPLAAELKQRFALSLQTEPPECNAMKINLFLGSLAAAALLCGSAVTSDAATRVRQHRVSQLTPGTTFHEGYERQYASARPGHLTDLVGDDYSGLGFYPLPHQYRAAAERYGRYRVATNAIRYAVASQAIETPYFFPAGGNGYRYGVFNPNDGVGTPFFAGYYAN